MLKRIFLLFIIPFFICSCTKNDIEEITFSSWGSITETEILANLISDFEKQNPKIKVNFIHIPQNYFQKLHLLFAASQAPDVIFINNLYLPLYANKLEDLTNYVEKEDYYKQSLEALSIDDKIFAIPRDISNLVFYVNTNLANVNTDWDFDKLKKTLDKINGNGFYPVSFERDVYFAEPYALTIENGLEYYKNLEGKYAPKPSEVGSSTLAQMFLDGKIALYLSGRWMYPKISEKANFEFKVVPFPGMVPADSSGWAISKSSKHKASAFKFIKYLSSKESIDYFTKTGLIVPARIDSSIALNNPNEKAFLDAIKKSQVLKITKDYKKERDRLNKELFN